MADDSTFWKRLSHALSGHELGLFLTAGALLLICFTAYMMFARYAMLAEHCARLHQENGELRTMLNVEALTDKADQDKLDRYREHLLKKYGDK